MAFPSANAGLLRLKAELKKLKAVSGPRWSQEIRGALPRLIPRTPSTMPPRRSWATSRGASSRWRHSIASAEVIDVMKHAGDRVVFGATVHLEDMTREQGALPDGGSSRPI